MANRVRFIGGPLAGKQMVMPDSGVLKLPSIKVPSLRPGQARKVPYEELVESARKMRKTLEGLARAEQEIERQDHDYCCIGPAADGVMLFLYVGMKVA